VNDLLLAEVRPTDVWDGGDIVGAIVLVALIAGSFVLMRVRRRR
jgi:hypothetical protein